MQAASGQVLKIGILGASGRMGQRIQNIANSLELRSKVEVSAKPGRNDDLASLFSCDAVIDFSLAEASMHLTEFALQWHSLGRSLPVFVVGTTGFALDFRGWDEVAKKTWVLKSANFSPGVQILLQALESIGTLYRNLGFESSMVDIHHIHKKDAPSGTALLLADTLDSFSHPRMPIESVREGEVIGTHAITLQGPGERLLLTHEAQSRDIFARGAILAGLSLVEVARKKTLLPGKLFSLREILVAAQR